MHNLGGKCVFASEIDKYARQTYFENFFRISPELFQNGSFNEDITNLDYRHIPDFDVLCAGFPCQAFSIAGRREGFNDTRGTLFFNIEKIIEIKRPKVIFLENVKNLQSHDHGKTFSIMKEILEKKLKYKVFYKVLNAMTHANIPQNRERIIIVGFDPMRVPSYNEFKFPPSISLSKDIDDFVEHSKQDNIFYYSKEHKYYPKLIKEITSTDTLYQWRRVYIRENKSRACPTLTANMGTGGHNVPLLKDKFGIRKLTPKECLSFMGFPKSFNFPNDLANSHCYKQAGNSIVVPLIERVAKEIYKLI